MPCPGSSAFGVDETNLANLFVARLLGGGEQACAGIVFQNVDPAEVCECPLNRLLHLLGVGHVEGQGKDCVAEAFGEVGDVCQLAGGRSNPVATHQRCFRPDAAETARSAGNKPCLFHIDSPCIWS